MDDSSGLARLDRRVTGCRACPRLVEWREEVARTKRAAFADWTYWGRPVPGFGPADARLVIVGLAPAAHGGNRTGRMFTGDRSGDVLYQALYDVGLASQPTSERIDDGLELYGVRITSPVHCAPPANKPTPGERDTCRPWLVQELKLLRPTVRAAVVLGAFGWQAALPAFNEAGWPVPRPRPAFAHGARVILAGSVTPEGSDGLEGADGPGGADDPEGPAGPGGLAMPGGPANHGGPAKPGGSGGPGSDGPDGPGRLDVFGCFHVSQRNTFTGRLTPAMLREVLRTAADAAGLP